MVKIGKHGSIDVNACRACLLGVLAFVMLGPKHHWDMPEGFFVAALKNMEVFLAVTSRQS